MSLLTFPSISKTLTDLASTPWLHPLNDLSALDGILARFDKSWSITRIKAPVIAARRETADTRTLMLRPNFLWPGHRSGQHVLVEVEIGGRLVRRTFTISSPPRADGTIEITVKRRMGGKLSRWWNDDAVVGDIVTVSPPVGQFVLPEFVPNRIVMISAGSGITPVMAIVRELCERAPETQILFMHCARSRAEVIFAAELEALARRRGNFDLRLHLTAVAGRIDDSSWAELAQAAGNDLTYVCGPPGFIDAARSAWRAAGRVDGVLTESFGLPDPVPCPGSGAQQNVRAERSGMSFPAAGAKSLLVEAEAAGLTPKYGCRIGICQTCKCRKLSGVVEDLRTGELSSGADEMIQLCVSAARSDVILDL